MIQNRLFQLAALLILAIIVGSVALIWPLPYLGFNADLPTGVVYEVLPGTTASDAGIMPGDRILHIYGYPWEQVNTQLLLVPLPWRAGTPTPMVIERDSRIFDLVLFAGPPSLSLQIEKGIRGMIALICWVTGFLLGTSPRAADVRLRRTGWFWVLLGGSLGLYALTQNVSYLLTVGVVWLQCSVLAPIAVALQCWYPPRPSNNRVQQRVWHALLIALGVMQGVAVAVVLTAPTTTMRYQLVHEIARGVFLASFGLSGIVLWRAYATTTIAHIRRQIRLIGAACVLACAWAIMLLLIQIPAPTVGNLVPPGAFPFGATLIPLAYLAGGIRADLMQLDQIARRALLHTLAVLLTLIGLIVGQQTGLFALTPAFGFVALVLLHIPLYRFLRRQWLPHSVEARRDRALRTAARSLATSLDASILADAVYDGVAAAFLRPPLAFYHATDTGSSLLTRIRDRHMNVPPTFDARLLDRWQQRGTVLLKATEIQQGLEHDAPDPQLAALIFHPAAVLWGVIRDQEQRLLGLVLLGPRGDDDPYQPHDLRAIEHLLDTAALAFTNSASYTAQVAARAELRELYVHAQQIEEQTAADIANRIHDQVISTELRLNMEQLTRVMDDVTDPDLHEQLADVLAGEESMGETLRFVCEQLKPTIQYDPLGLTLNLRQETKWLRANWRKPIELQIEHNPVPLTRQVQRALVKITHEALVNAVAHGKPTSLLVRLRFPSASGEALVLTIVNDGPPPPQPIEPKPHHWGVRNMREYADSIEATIQWVYPEAGGTRVVVTLPPEITERVVLTAQKEMADDESHDIPPDPEPVGAMRQSTRLIPDHMREPTNDEASATTGCYTPPA